MEAELHAKVRDSLGRAEGFLLGQLGPHRPGWGSEPGAELDPWTTAQICFLLGRSDRSDLIRRAVIWLRDKQKPDGSWSSTAYNKEGDTPTTACATISVLHHFGTHSLASQRGLQWLCKNFKNGWTTLPGEAESRFANVHYYSSAYAVRALARAPILPIYSLCFQEGVTALRRIQVPGQGWGFQPDGPTDATYTCYVLHGLLDARRVLASSVEDERIRIAANWLLSRQTAEGFWGDWHGVDDSPEATGYSVYILLSIGVSPESPPITSAVKWLLKSQSLDGSWSLSGRNADAPNNWVTYTAVMGLKAFALQMNPKTASDSLVVVNSSNNISKISLCSLDEVISTDNTEELPTKLLESTAELGWDGNIGQLYSTAIRMPWRDMPYTRDLDHTMYKALDGYVSQKLPRRVIIGALNSGTEIQVLGVAPQHIEYIASQLRFRKIEHIEFSHKKKQDNLNEQRPQFYRAESVSGAKAILVCVMPGRDYVMHYASLVRHFAFLHTQAAERFVHVTRFPLAENMLTRWTELNPSVVFKNDRVLLGCITPIREIIEQHSSFTYISKMENAWYCSYRYQMPNAEVINLLGVKYCFWGSISEVLVHGLCELGASEIIYCAKLGALTSHHDLYERIFCPSKFLLLNYKRLVDEPSVPPNGILTWRPKLSTGCHVSVPTVLEEDYEQRNVVAEYKAKSIDNEISQMVKAISAFNDSNTFKVKFSAVHFATDYVRKQKDRTRRTSHDLEKNRTMKAKGAKRRIIQKIAKEILIPYWLLEHYNLS